MLYLSGIFSVLVVMAGLVACDGSEKGAKEVEVCNKLYAKTTTTSTKCDIKVYP